MISVPNTKTNVLLGTQYNISSNSDKGKNNSDNYNSI